MLRIHWEIERIKIHCNVYLDETSYHPGGQPLLWKEASENDGFLLNFFLASYYVGEASKMDRMDRGGSTSVNACMGTIIVVTYLFEGEYILGRGGETSPAKPEYREERTGTTR